MEFCWVDVITVDDRGVELLLCLVVSGGLPCVIEGFLILVLVFDLLLFVILERWIGCASMLGVVSLARGGREIQNRGAEWVRRALCDAAWSDGQHWSLCY